jgi:hypothetical protein
MGTVCERAILRGKPGPPLNAAYVYRDYTETDALAAKPVSLYRIIRRAVKSAGRAESAESAIMK